METNYVVAYGNAFDGLTLTGPFHDYESALTWAEDNEGDYADWRIVPLEPV